MATEAQQEKYSELKLKVEALGWPVKFDPASCQMLIQKEGPRHIQVYVSTLGKIVLLGTTVARWESTDSQEAVDFIDSL